MYTIYLIEDHRYKPYIGVTSKPIEKRFKEHKYAARYGKKNSYLYEAMRKYGEDKFDIIPLDTASTEKKSFELEKEWIKNLGSYKDWGYNITPGGEGLGLGKDHPRYNSSGLSGENAPMYGKSHTKEARKKIGKAKTGENHPSHKISDEEAIKAVVEYRTTNKHYSDLANKYNISDTQIRQIDKGISRGYLQDRIDNKMKSKSKNIKKSIGKYSGKLNIPEVRKIKWLSRNSDLYQKEIANMYNITSTTVSEIKNEKTYKNIKQEKPEKYE